MFTVVFGVWLFLYGLYLRLSNDKPQIKVGSMLMFCIDLDAVTLALFAIIYLVFSQSKVYEIILGSAI